MILPVYVYGMPVLRKRAKEIKPDYKDLDQLIDDMFETMYHADGVGLAAPQIGKSIRLIVIDASEIEDESDPSLKDFKIVLDDSEKSNEYMITLYPRINAATGIIYELILLLIGASTPTTPEVQRMYFTNRALDALELAALDISEFNHENN